LIGAALADTGWLFARQDRVEAAGMLSMRLHA